MLEEVLAGSADQELAKAAALELAASVFGGRHSKLLIVRVAKMCGGTG